MKKNIFAVLLLSAAVLAGCGSAKIEGRWIEPVPGMPGMVQGIEIGKDGKASSINMATLVYESWERQGDELILRGRSVGNRQTIRFSDTQQIEKLTADSLVLRSGEVFRRYSREKE